MKKILKNIFVILTKHEKRQFGILIFFDILISIIDILSLALLLWIIQFYIQPGIQKPDFFPAWLADNNSVMLIAIFVIFFASKNLAAFFNSRKQFRFISKVAVRISGNSLKNYQQAEFEEFITVDSSVQIRKIAFQPFDYCQFILAGSQQVITHSSLIIIAIIAILLFNAELFILLLCILLPPIVIIFYFIKKHLGNTKMHLRSNNERSFQYLLDALKGYVEGNIYNRNKFFLERFINYRRKFSTYLFDSMSIQTLPSRIIESFAVLGLFILIAIAKFTGNTDGTTIITIGAFMAAAYRIIPGVVKIININGQMRAYEFSLDEMTTDKKSKIDNNEEEVADIDSIQLKNISFKYKELRVLNRFDLDIRKGGFLGITGRSGKGKTTILNIILGFLTPENGCVLINNYPVDTPSLKRYWAFIAYVRQQNFFIHDTILRNVTLEEDGFDKNKLLYALKISGVEQLVQNFPEGLEKIITENGKNISGGQQQRIAIARALYKNANVILLDEPFNELDEAAEISLLEHFRELSKNGKLIILNTHDKKALSYCNKIISLDEQ